MCPQMIWRNLSPPHIYLLEGDFWAYPIISATAEMSTTTILKLIQVASTKDWNTYWTNSRGGGKQNIFWSYTNPIAMARAFKLMLLLQVVTLCLFIVRINQGILEGGYSGGHHQRERWENQRSHSQVTSERQWVNSASSIVATTLPIAKPLSMTL